jgi:SlyX protein
MEGFMDRLIEIETKLAFQEDAIQALNDVVCRQQKQLEQLEAALSLLIDRYRQLSQTQTSASKPVDEKPPHY